MPRYKNINGVKIQYTPEEEAARDIEEKVDLSKKMPDLVKKLDKALIKFLEDADAETKQIKT